MLAEEVLRGIRDFFRGDVRGFPARLSAVTREAEGTISSGLKVVRPQERITTVMNARFQPRLEAEATQERRLYGVGCKPLILIEAPSSAYRRGMLSLDNNHSHAEETSGDSTPNSTNFIVVSTCTLVPCTSVF